MFAEDKKLTWKQQSLGNGQQPPPLNHLIVQQSLNEEKKTIEIHLRLVEQSRRSHYPKLNQEKLQSMSRANIITIISYRRETERNR